MKILIVAGSGLIGKALCKELATHTVTLLSHKKITPENLDGFDAIINLAGEPITGRWSSQKKEKIYKSRVETTRLLVQSLAKVKKLPEVFISASAIGYYGETGEQEVIEQDSCGSTFLAQVCKDWEAESLKLAGCRVIITRFGTVLSAEGGALAKMLPAFRFNLGGTLGSGEQWMSFISIDDLAAACHFLLKSNSARGIYNFTAPLPVQNKVFTKTLAILLKKKAILPLPSWLVILLFGQMGKELLLCSCKALPNRLLDAGFSFTHPDLESSVKSCLNK